MMEPKHIVAGKTYDVLFGDEPLAVLITGRAETGPDNYLWRGTILITGQTTRICNPNRFVKESPPDSSGIPWMLTLDVRKEELEQKPFALEWFSVSIRERDTLRLVADMPNIPAEIFPHCAEVIRNAIRICRSGPVGSDGDLLHFFEEEEKYLHGVSVDLAFDLWEPAYASDDYFKALFQRIHDASRNFGKNPTIQDDFQANPDGVGAVYWTEKDGVVKVLWPDHPFLKTAFLQSEKVIADFAESLFGEHDHSFETLRKLLDSHEGEWFDPPENIELFDTYRAIRFDSVYLDDLPLVYASDAGEGKKYYGRIVACERKASCPEITNWTAHQNKIWFRVNHETDDQEYFGPFDNHLAAAQEAYRQFFR